ncbi:MAG TPA: protein-disulfide reductase DsbD domain-containing protein [Methyloceanibacter sp.]|nr:protein-disulfide reductase DsbD domain-containing protein [Methyloceanibacter sp.]
MSFEFLRRPTGVSLFAVSAIALAAAGATLGAASSATPWTASTNSKVRLVAGTANDGGGLSLLAGVQLRMDEGWKTYWRNPGDSGVPPSFDWAGSKNLKSAEVLYPAPHRFDDAGGTAIGYSGDVLFPVRLTRERDGEPIELNLVFAYGLCKDLCIPNEVSLSLALAADAGQGEALLLDAALAQVPKPARAGLLPEVKGVETNLDGDAPGLVVDAVFPPGATGTDLLIDGGDVFVPPPASLGASVDGRERFAVTFASPSEAAAIKGKTLRLTLVSDQGSTETMWKAE